MSRNIKFSGNVNVIENAMDFDWKGTIKVFSYQYYDAKLDKILTQRPEGYIDNIEIFRCGQINGVRGALYMKNTNNKIPIKNISLRNSDDHGIRIVNSPVELINNVVANT